MLELPLFLVLVEPHRDCLAGQMPDEDKQPTERQIATPTVSIVDLIEPGEVGLYCVTMVPKESQQAGYSPVEDSPIVLANASKNLA